MGDRYHPGVLISRRAPAAPVPTITSADFVTRFLHPGVHDLATRPALAARHGDGWTELTYAELDRCSGLVAGWLRCHRVVPGDRVALLAEPGIEWVVAFFGILRAGGVVVPLDARMTAAELRPLWRRVAPTAAVCAPQRLEVLESGCSPAAVPVFLLTPGVCGSGPVPASTTVPASGTTVPVEPAPVDATRPANAPAMVVFTAGTTAAPKGVTLSFANIAYVVTEAVRGHRPRPGDGWLSVLPLSHMLELACGLLPALASGGCFSIAGTLMPHEMVAAMAERRTTRMVAVPLVLRILQRHPDADFAPLETIYCGGAALDPDLARYFEARGIAVYQGYGLTEMSPIVSMSAPDRNRLGAVGPPLPGTEVRIAGAVAPGGPGEVLVRGPGLMLGYWGDETLTSSVVDAEGWFHTGDVGYLDADGFLHLTGRARDLIVLQSGKKVQPEDVESTVESSPLVREACVLGMPAPGRHGDEVWAVVVPSEAAATAPEGTVEAEVQRVAATLSGYKRPARVVVVPGPLPRTPKGSLRRGEVRRLLGTAANGSA